MDHAVRSEMSWDSADLNLPAVCAWTGFILSNVFALYVDESHVLYGKKGHLRILNQYTWNRTRGTLLCFDVSLIFC